MSASRNTIHALRRSTCRRTLAVDRALRVYVPILPSYHIHSLDRRSDSITADSIHSERCTEATVSFIYGYDAGWCDRTRRVPTRVEVPPTPRSHAEQPRHRGRHGSELGAEGQPHDAMSRPQHSANGRRDGSVCMSFHILHILLTVGRQNVSRHPQHMRP